MKDKRTLNACCRTSANGPGCCKIESLITVDERGQMVLPKETREKAHIKPGDKFALITWENDGEVSCFSLIKADKFSGMVKNLLGPILGAITKK